MLLVRHTQHQILSNAIRRFERGLLYRNLKAEKNAQGGKGKHVSIMPSSPTASVSAPRGESWEGWEKAGSVVCLLASLVCVQNPLKPR